MKSLEISGKSTMQEIMDAYPDAKQALFERYHIGGCSSCGFSPTDTLEQVLSSKGNAGVEEAINHIKERQLAADENQIGPKELAKLMEEKKVKLIDVRTPEERNLAFIEGDQFASEELVQEIMGTWPKDTFMVFYCHKGVRSLQAVTHLSSQGFTNIKSLKGGIDSWSTQVDPLLPSY